MTQRATTDENFIGRAFDLAEYDDAHEIANQYNFNNNGAIPPLVHAALITATAIYVERNRLAEPVIEEAIALKTLQEARLFIDKHIAATIDADNS